MLKYVLVILLLASSAFGITVSGRVSPTDDQFAALGSHIYVQLINGDTANVNATAHPNPFGYYSFPNVIPDHVYYIVAYPGKTPDGWGLEFNPTLRVMLTELDDIDNMDFTYTPFQTCLESPC